MATIHLRVNNLNSPNTTMNESKKDTYKIISATERSMPHQSKRNVYFYSALCLISVVFIYYSTVYNNRTNNTKVNGNRRPTLTSCVWEEGGPVLYNIRTKLGVSYEASHWFHMAENVMAQHSILRESNRLANISSLQTAGQVFYNFDNKRFVAQLNGVTKLLVALGTIGAVFPNKMEDVNEEILREIPYEKKVKVLHYTHIPLSSSLVVADGIKEYSVLHNTLRNVSIHHSSSTYQKLKNKYLLDAKLQSNLKVQDLIMDDVFLLPFNVIETQQSEIIWPIAGTSLFITGTPSQGAGHRIVREYVHENNEDSITNKTSTVVAIQDRIKGDLSVSSDTISIQSSVRYFRRNLMNESNIFIHSDVMDKRLQNGVNSDTIYNLLDGNSNETKQNNNEKDYTRRVTKSSKNTSFKKLVSDVCVKFMGTIGGEWPTPQVSRTEDIGRTVDIRPIRLD